MINSFFRSGWGVSFSFVLSSIVLIFSFQNCAKSNFEKVQDMSAPTQNTEAIVTTSVMPSTSADQGDSLVCQFTAPVDQFTENYYLIGINRRSDGLFFAHVQMNLRATMTQSSIQAGQVLKSAESDIIEVDFKKDANGLESIRSKPGAVDKFEIVGVQRLNSILQLARFSLDMPNVNQLGSIPLIPRISLAASSKTGTCQHMHDGQAQPLPAASR